MKKNLIVITAVLVALGSPASAAINPVADRASLGATDSIQWDVLGTTGTVLPTPLSVNTTLGEAVEVRAEGDLKRLDQGFGWSGDFLEGSQLLFSNGNFQMEIDPEYLFQGAGLQIQADFFGDYTANLSAFDGNGNLLGAVNGSGRATGSADDSALFLGFLSDAFDVDKFIVRLTSAASMLDSFAINHVSLVTDENSQRGLPILGSPVPEAKNAALMGGLALLIAGAWSRARNRLP